MHCIKAHLCAKAFFKSNILHTYFLSSSYQFIHFHSLRVISEQYGQMLICTALYIKTTNEKDNKNIFYDSFLWLLKAESCMYLNTLFCIHVPTTFYCLFSINRHHQWIFGDMSFLTHFEEKCAIVSIKSFEKRITFFIRKAL